MQSPPAAPTVDLAQPQNAQVSQSTPDDDMSLPPTPPTKPPSHSAPITSPSRHDSIPETPTSNGNAQKRDEPVSTKRPHPNGRSASGAASVKTHSRANSTELSRKSLTISRGHTVSAVLISSALETIAASREAKRSAPLRESVQKALEMVKAGQGGDKPREIFEPLRLACETRNEKLMIASLDCISKLISYSFFVESNPPTDSQPPPSPPLSPAPNARTSMSNGSHPDLPTPSLVDLVVHTITSCHTETTPETVSLQIVKALLALVLSSTILVHQSSLLKAVRTVYNVFLLSVDPVNQMVAQGGLAQMVNHVFARCKINPPSLSRSDSNATISSRTGDGETQSRKASWPSSPRGPGPLPLSPSPHVRPSSIADTDSATLGNGEVPTDDTHASEDGQSVTVNGSHDLDRQKDSQVNEEEPHPHHVP